ncbi:MAG: alanine/ornithine racemase family PLP-dependent enzyme [Kordiimonas sp.]
MFPQVSINRAKLSENIRVIKGALDLVGVEVAAVTKAFGAHPDIANVFVEGGVEVLADSRLENLAKLVSFRTKKMLLRLPALSEVDSVVRFADISLVSHLETAQHLSESAGEQGQYHGLILMMDLGDLREGIFCSSTFIETALAIQKLPNLSLEGVGANFCCVGGLIPSHNEVQRLNQLVLNIEERSHISVRTISAGNSSSLHLICGATSATPITQLRIGEAFLLGRETAYGKRIPGTYSDCFTLHAEIIEKQRKPSVPVGEIGTDGFGNKPSFVDNGEHWRAICAVGRQDVDLSQLTPVDNRISVVGGSSDHLILNIEACSDDYGLGDIVDFSLSYSGILGVMASPYVNKKIIQ